jgi:[ribosomal protein S5]-alanine N-acetyltransferase
MRSFEQLALRTGRLLLRPLRPVDTPAVLAMFSDPRFMKFVTAAPFRTIDEAQALVVRDMTAMAAGERIRLALERLDDGAVIGNCTLFQFDQRDASAELGYGLVGSAWGQGYMHEALLALLHYGFSELGLPRVEAEIDPLNTDSTRSLLRLAFTQRAPTGADREQGEADSVRYALSRGDWDSTRRA